MPYSAQYNDILTTRRAIRHSGIRAYFSQSFLSPRQILRRLSRHREMLSGDIRMQPPINFALQITICSNSGAGDSEAVQRSADALRDGAPYALPQRYAVPPAIRHFFDAILPLSPISADIRRSDKAPRPLILLYLPAGATPPFYL
jgi:hypothetical protein